MIFHIISWNAIKKISAGGGESDASGAWETYH